MSERMNDETVDQIVRGALGDQPQGELSPFFAARTANAARIDARDHQRIRGSRAGSVVMAAYWFLLLASAILLITPYAASGAGRAILAILVPIGFALALYWREIMLGLLRFVSVFLE